MSGFACGPDVRAGGSLSGQLPEIATGCRPKAADRRPDRMRSFKGRREFAVCSASHRILKSASFLERSADWRIDGNNKIAGYDKAGFKHG